MLAALEAEQEEAQSLGELDRYLITLRDHTRAYWIRPPSSRRGLVCTVEVILLPGGEVQDVRLVRSSGDRAYDRSVIAAIFKASPLPVPSGRLFEQFRRFHYEFKAEN